MRFFASLFVAFAVVAASGAQTVRMRVTQNSQAIGTAEFIQVLRPGGGKVANSQLHAKGPGATLTMKENASYASSGAALQKELVLIVNGKQVGRIAAKFDATGANVTVERGGAKQQKRFPLPKGAVTADASENWFITTRPKPGTKVKSYTLSLSGMQMDLNSVKWEPSEATYVGDREITVGNRKVKGHLIRETDADSQTEVVVDDKGMPLQIQDQNGLFMVRI